MPSHPATVRLARRRALAALAAAGLSALAACGDTAPTAPARAPALRRAPTLDGAETPARTLFVDAAAGSDANPGTQAQPFKSLGRALATATAGDLVLLATGSYTSTGGAAASGDVYPLHVPDGVTIRGTLQPGGAKGTFLSPASSAAHTTGLILDGSAVVQDLEMDVFGTAIDAREGEAGLFNLNLVLNLTGVRARGSAYVKLINPYLFVGEANGVSAVEGARVLVNGGEVASAGCRATGTGIRAADSAAVEVVVAKLDVLVNGAVALFGTATGTLTNVDVVTPAAPCPVLQSILAGGASRLTMTDVRASGVASVPSAFVSVSRAAALTATDLAVSNYAYGVSAAALARVTLTRGTFAKNGIAVNGDAGTRLDVTSVAFTDNQIGLRAPKLKLRGSWVLGGKFGVIALGGEVDLGTAADAGKNTFTGATDTEVRFAPAQGGLEVPAVGNVWHRNVQSAAADGTYGLVSASSRGPLAGGPNFKLVEPAGSAALTIRLNP